MSYTNGMINGGLQYDCPDPKPAPVEDPNPATPEIEPTIPPNTPLPNIV